MSSFDLAHLCLRPRCRQGKLRTERSLGQKMAMPTLDKGRRTVDEGHSGGNLFVIRHWSFVRLSQFRVKSKVCPLAKFTIGDSQCA
jgi:hypothetical protein